MSGAATKRIIEIDTMTGNEREIPTLVWEGESAEAAVEWRKTHITGRYQYRIEDDA